MELLQIENLFFGYTKEDILKNINLKVFKGDFIALLGSNGAGKSTLIKLILRELKPREGKISYFKSDEEFYKAIAYVPQIQNVSSKNFPITVSELISLGKYRDLKGFRFIGKDNSDFVLDALSLVGMEDYKDRLYSKLSGGQRQRVLLAKALSNSPDILLLDEPTNGVDEKTVKRLYQLLYHLNKFHNTSILMITHDISGVKDYVNKIYELKEGSLIKKLWVFLAMITW